MAQLKQLSKKQIDIVKGKVAGKSGREIGKQVYPNAKPETQSVMVSREIKKDNVQAALQEAFKKNGITLDAAIEPIGKALKATKIVIHGNKEDAFAEEVEDLDLQLKGSDRALKLMGIGQDTSGVTNNFLIISSEQKEKYGM